MHSVRFESPGMLDAKTLKKLKHKGENMKSTHLKLVNNKHSEPAFLTERPNSKICGLCNHVFYNAKRHSLFCKECKLTNERYRFAEWLNGAIAI